jgi:hypothetical protein
MNRYRIDIPKDILTMFVSLIKKDKILRSFLITPTAVLVQTLEGCLCYTHNIEIPEFCSFVFPFDPAIKPGSDMSIEWDTVTNTAGSTHVENAKYIFSNAVLNIEHVSCSEKTLPQLPTFQPFSRSLAAAIPTLSKYATSDRDIRVFPGIVFTDRSAFATDAVRFAGWTDSSFTSEVGQTTSAFLAAYLKVYNQFMQETKTAFTTFYEDCTNNPQKYFESFQTNYGTDTPESWLADFLEEFPDLETFTDRFCQIPTDPPSSLPIAFPKYLEKILTQDACSYGFATDYTQGFPFLCCDSSPDMPVYPSSITFFLSTSTYAGRKLPGQLIWHTSIDPHRARSTRPLDTLLFTKFTDIDDKYRYMIPTSAFIAIQDHAKKHTRHSKTSASGIAFVNHNGKLGIGNLLDHEIHSTPTSLPLPVGIEQHISIPIAFADIPVPTNLSSITLILDESNDDIPVCIIVGNITYIYARIGDFTPKGDRASHTIRFHDTPLSIPLTPKLLLTPAVVK